MKISVVDSKFNVVYETLVLPKNPVLDYNTDFSGMTETSLNDVVTTIDDVHDHLLEMFSQETIIIGHGLRNDFKALKLLHLKVIDTEEVFPHPKGFPRTFSLKYLIDNKLNMSIPVSVNGNKSRHDAIACMNLMLRKEFCNLN